MRTFEIGNIPLVKQFREILNSMGIALDVVPSPRIVSLRAFDGRRNGKLILQYSPGSPLQIIDMNKADKLLLIDIGSRFLIGNDESLFVHRLPDSNFGQRVRNLNEALDAITPPSVKEAIKNGLQVLRQGDLWFVPIVCGKESYNTPQN